MQPSRPPGDVRGAEFRQPNPDRWDLRMRILVIHAVVAGASLMLMTPRPVSALIRRIIPNLTIAQVDSRFSATPHSSSPESNC